MASVTAKIYSHRTRKFVSIYISRVELARDIYMLSFLYLWSECLRFFYCFYTVLNYTDQFGYPVRYADFVIIPGYYFNQFSDSFSHSAIYN